MESMYFIALDVQKKLTRFWVKDLSSRLHGLIYHPLFHAVAVSVVHLLVLPVIACSK